MEIKLKMLLGTERKGVKKGEGI